jgi:hypothetical protein
MKRGATKSSGSQLSSGAAPSSMPTEGTADPMLAQIAMVGYASTLAYWRNQIATAKLEMKTAQARIKYAEKQYLIIHDLSGFASSDSEPPRKKARVAKVKQEPKVVGKGKRKEKAHQSDDDSYVGAS